MSKTMYHYTQPNCKTPDKKHTVAWNYKEMEYDGDCDCVRLFGHCSVCGHEFEKTFVDNRLTIYGKNNRIAYNFDREIVEIN